jgi:hypothetical protein
MHPEDEKLLVIIAIIIISALYLVMVYFPGVLSFNF